MKPKKKTLSVGWVETHVVRFLKTDKIFLTVLVLALFTPLMFHGPRIGVPYVKGGDEPHYLVMLNSLLKDGDWDLKNNYDSVWNGGNDAGKKWAGSPIDPHAWYLLNGKVVSWADVIVDPVTLTKNAQGVIEPATRPGVDYSKVHAVPLHPYGMPALLALLLWPFKNTPYIEALSLLTANLSVIVAAFIFRKLMRRYTKKNWVVNAATLIVFLGTPFWAYGRTLFAEPFLIFFALAAYWAILEKKSGFWSGIFLGLGMFIKPTLCVILFPVGLFWLLRKEWGNILRLAIGPALALGFYLYTNNQLFGSPFYFSQHYSSGNLLIGFFGLWFDWKHSILAFTPVAIFALFFWGRFLKEEGAEAWLWLGGFFSYFLFMANLPHWDAGWSYGPREIVPVISFIMVPIFYAFEALSSSQKWVRWVFVALCLLSLAFNLLGAMDGYWDSHPLTIFMGNFS